MAQLVKEWECYIRYGAPVVSRIVYPYKGPLT
jgi:hypothetical protein